MRRLWDPTTQSGWVVLDTGIRSTSDEITHATAKVCQRIDLFAFLEKNLNRAMF